MKPRTTNIHQLVLGADGACAHHDASRLAEVVRQLLVVAPKPLHDELTALRNVANSPNGDPFAGWASLRLALVEYLRDDVDHDRAEQQC